VAFISPLFQTCDMLIMPKRVAIISKKPENAEARPDYVIAINLEQVSCTQYEGAYCRRNADCLVM